MVHVPCITNQANIPLRIFPLKLSLDHPQDSKQTVKQVVATPLQKKKKTAVHTVGKNVVFASARTRAFRSPDAGRFLAAGRNYCLQAEICLQPKIYLRPFSKSACAPEPRKFLPAGRFLPEDHNLPASASRPETSLPELFNLRKFNLLSRVCFS